MRRSAAVLALTLGLAAAGAARAGPYADDLSKCLAGRMSDADRTQLAVWLYEEMSANPTLKPMSNVTDAQRTDARKSVAAVVQRLLIEDCRAQASAALRNEGGGVALRSFWGIAQDSIGSLARDPAVLSNMQQIGQYFDTAKLIAALSDAGAGGGDKK
jgi:hypothetical protein